MYCEIKEYWFNLSRLLSGSVSNSRGSSSSSSGRSLTIGKHSTITNIVEETRVGILVGNSTIGTNTDKVLTRSIVGKRVEL